MLCHNLPLNYLYLGIVYIPEFKYHSKLKGAMIELKAKNVIDDIPIHAYPMLRSNYNPQTSHNHVLKTCHTNLAVTQIEVFFTCIDAIQEKQHILKIGRKTSKFHLITSGTY